MNLLQSENINELITALVKAKLEFAPIRFDERGARNEYASLGSLLESIKIPLLKNGLDLSQEEMSENDKYYLFTKLTHISGQWKGVIAPLIIDPNQKGINLNQQYGAALTYARRYSLSSFLGLYADSIDIDKENVSSANLRANGDKHNLVGVSQLEYLKKLEPEVQEIVLNFNKVSRLEELTMQQFENFKTKFEK